MNITEFFSQGGYGFYVWSSYGMALVLLVTEIIQLRRQRSTILARIGRLIRMRVEEAKHESKT